MFSTMLVMHKFSQKKGGGSKLYLIWVVQNGVVWDALFWNKPFSAKLSHFKQKLTSIGKNQLFLLKIRDFQVSLLRNVSYHLSKLSNFKLKMTMLNKKIVFQIYFLERA